MPTTPRPKMPKHPGAWLVLVILLSAFSVCCLIGSVVWAVARAVSGPSDLWVLGVAAGLAVLLITTYLRS